VSDTTLSVLASVLGTSCADRQEGDGKEPTAQLTFSSRSRVQPREQRVDQLHGDRRQGDRHAAGLRQGLAYVAPTTSSRRGDSACSV
jgi:hypothetical protein